MTKNSKFANWTARLRAPLFTTLMMTLAACNSTDSFTPPSSTNPESIDDGSTTALDEPSLSSSYVGGIPAGLFHLPESAVGTHYNGLLRNIFPNQLLPALRAIKARGGKVMLVLAGAPPRYTDRSGNFSLSMWKNSMDRYRNINFSSYINDGTVIGHFLIDEPQDKANWRNHRPISASTVEEMARYSKSRWPNLATIARVRPWYLLNNHRYLDAAWSQYLAQNGDAARFVANDAAQARSKGLALVVGLNVLNGGGHRRPMSASQVRSFGLALLSSSYPCAFISWKYSSRYVASSSMKDAMRAIWSKARSRPSKSCRS